MLIALSREQIHVGRRIFTLESRPFPGRSVYVAQKPLGASGNTWSLQRLKERLGAGLFLDRKGGECRLDSTAELWPRAGLSLGLSRVPIPKFQRAPKAPVPAVSKKLLLLCVCSLGSTSEWSTCPQPWACAGTLLDPYLLQLIIYDYK